MQTAKGNVALATVVELLNVSLDFTTESNRHSVFRNLNLKIEKGEICVLIGPSGQGKSTLLKLMATLVQPTTGELRLFENSFDQKLSDEEKYKIILRLGMLFQKNALFDSMTVLENLIFPLRELDFMEDQHEKARGLLSEVGLAEHESKFPSEMSGGMQKRLGLARALVLNPELLLCDDPTAGLDPITSRKITDLILRSKVQHNSTMVIVTNDVGRIVQLGGRLVYVSKDGLIDCGVVKNLGDIENQVVQEFIYGS